MMTLYQKSAKIWLSIPEYPLEAIPASAYIRCSLTTTVKNILEKCDNSVSTEGVNNQGILPNIKVFFNSIKTSQKVYKISLSITLKNYSKLSDFMPPSEIECCPRGTKDTTHHLWNFKSKRNYCCSRWQRYPVFSFPISKKIS